MPTSTRILDLLSCLQGRRHWPAAELAERLGVSTRTLRRDIEGLQDLGYPIASTRGTGGGYQLSAGTSLPPLVLSEDEATAVVLGLKQVAAGSPPMHGEAAIGALAKIVQVLPSRIRRRIDSLGAMTSTAKISRRPAPADVSQLTTLALACRDAEGVCFEYTAADGRHSTRRVEPYRIVHDIERIYVIAFDLDRAGWRTFRIDRMKDIGRSGRPFAGRELPFSDAADYVRRQQRRIEMGPRVVITVQASSSILRAELDGFLEVEEEGANGCRITGHLTWGETSMQWIGFVLGSVGVPFTVHEPTELAEYLEAWGRLFVSSAGDASREVATHAQVQEPTTPSCDHGDAAPHHTSAVPSPTPMSRARRASP